jgi:hypothetical protein
MKKAASSLLRIGSGGTAALLIRVGGRRPGAGVLRMFGAQRRASDLRFPQFVIFRKCKKIKAPPRHGEELFTA